MFRPDMFQLLHHPRATQRRWPLLMTRFVGLVLLAGLPLAAGCSSSPDGVAEVSGVVLLDQEPLANAIVTFFPVEGGRPSTGKTDPTGSYRLVYTRDSFGALVGEHDVEISTIETQGKEIVPDKYNSKSALLEQVDSGSNEIDFTLTSS